MKRSAPLKRTPFRAKAPPPRPAKTTEYTPRPRSPAAAPLAQQPQAAPVPKFAYVRDTRIRDACRALPCQHCGAVGPDAGVTWAHSNQGIHGHARGIKASDVYVAALCWVCHRELDQGKQWDRATRVAIWTAAHLRTVALAVLLGLWPRDVPVPAVAPEEPTALQSPQLAQAGP